MHLIVHLHPILDDTSTCIRIVQTPQVQDYITEFVAVYGTGPRPDAVRVLYEVDNNMYERLLTDIKYKNFKNGATLQNVVQGIWLVTSDDPATWFVETFMPWLEMRICMYIDDQGVEMYKVESVVPAAVTLIKPELYEESTVFLFDGLVEQVYNDDTKYVLTNELFSALILHYIMYACHYVTQEVRFNIHDIKTSTIETDRCTNGVVTFWFRDQIKNYLTITDVVALLSALGITQTTLNNFITTDMYKTFVSSIQSVSHNDPYEKNYASFDWVNESVSYHTRPTHQTTQIPSTYVYKNTLTNTIHVATNTVPLKLLKEFEEITTHISIPTLQTVIESFNGHEINKELVASIDVLHTILTKMKEKLHVIKQQPQPADPQFLFTKEYVLDVTETAVTDII